MSSRDKRCWICGRARGMEVRREGWSARLPTVYVPRTDSNEDRPAQITNDLMIGAYVRRNGGANDETHICGKCLTIGLRAIKTEVSNLLDELGESHALEEQVVALTKRLASFQARFDRVAYDHNRMQERLGYTLAKVPAPEFENNDELRYARWEVKRGPVAQLGYAGAQWSTEDAELVAWALANTLRSEESRPFDGRFCLHYDGDDQWYLNGDYGEYPPGTEATAKFADMRPLSVYNLPSGPEPRLTDEARTVLRQARAAAVAAESNGEVAGDG